MPHLTPAGTASADPAPTGAEATDRLGVGVPGWAHPMLAPGEWRELSRTGAPLHWAVLNLNLGRGPGDRPDPYCVAAVARLREAGVPVLGHVEMRRGLRPFAEVVSDSHHFLDWYGVNGFYLAHCPSGADHLHETRRTTRTLRALSGGGTLVLGHGTLPHPEYARLADQLVTFEGGWPDYRWSQVAEWTADHPPERFCHLVHGVPGAHLDEALGIARWQGAGTVYFTDRGTADGVNPWETQPGYWKELVSRLGTSVSE